ncbi:transcriptional coactivator p15/PC4 family protein [Sulfitobacter pseudonitzschiae]|uniref:Transcriptional coactivator p15/PC4 family protein n=1 Tax=Pseudosulfitobacter pseudonitzschiae TaxID=1402135 RepID=A0A9Q2RU31_9RHOB|nr:transcriptional coactivator p15/PC4 family protein [Pseudosulfitobacter pseudonitzschiae]MBM2303890.1 transcriptional coactivator p15/PC4 family protein [Pseudosulfitobacter pseudonitzschiae]MBM2314725.1 transcriptional coactivator p15/PC4 family protein [Pseudosulfitobacter pseudonitzschiae]MBM2337754.1 transcriptional coactivator p15/PC4 family protein [Pseudosulfitobacter pseudonitzschiae]MBM2356695.1 transcriptional coactivator p15/PC4 family protein [Pseudosulfitobacter pseudonitzschiae
MADIVKNSREIIRVTRDDFKGHDMVNVRVFFDAGGGEMKPGKQGVAFRAALLPDVLNALGQFLGENV